MSADLPIQMLDLPKGRKPAGKSKKKTVMPSNYTNVGIYMTKTLKAKLAVLAKADRRSLSNFVVRTLQGCVENQSIDEHGVIVQHIPAARK
ncbi:MAG: hypothetical protein Q8M05_13020 [Rhodoferax sp.]|uniref:hypothetical protein n=1 Tax=Rhodoferax sp. TaxID=50421 RepID=UPI00272F5520|nr:hypothetical protein [Rhodoferax sp.]MDP1530296.1 hypothetical protein [Rhodoferax sp.]MDP1943357.1 hypothetical protein [Rhodoferax sp.]